MYLDAKWGWRYWNTHLNCWAYIDHSDEEYVCLSDVNSQFLPYQIQQRKQSMPRWEPTFISYFKYNYRQFEKWAFPPERYP